MFFKKPKLEFYCTIEGVDSVMPIIESKKYIHEWKNESIKKFNLSKKNNERHSSVARCPGINLIQSQGWIIRTWQDVAIETYNNDTEFSWKTPANQETLNSEAYINYHDQSNTEHFKNWPKNTLKNIIKFNTGWRAKIPKGFMLLQLPVFYSDENRFTTCSGAYDYGIATLNVPVYWHELNDNTLIRAGTPIAQLILVPKEEYSFKITDVDHKAEKLAELINSNTFIKNYKNIKDFWRNV